MRRALLLTVLALALTACRVDVDVATRVNDDGSGIVEVTVTLEIEASLPNGASDQIVRTVTENSRTLKFTSHGFEKE